MQQICGRMPAFGKDTESMKVVVIGGVAAGASAACRARRMDDSAEIIMFEKGPYVSFANCGLPYYVGGTIADRDDLLLVTPELFKERFHIDVRLFSDVTAISRDKKTVSVLCDGKTIEESYDKLIIAPGCEPVRPPIEGIDLKNISTVFTVTDVDAIMATIGTGAVSAVVVGGGFIGIETAEGLAGRGIRTTVVEMQPQLMNIFDKEFSKPMEQHLAAAGIDVKLGVGVKAFHGTDGKVDTVVLADGSEIAADLVIMSAGVRPRTELAAAAGLAIGTTRGILVNEYMQTSDPDIYAAGDAVESFHRVTGAPVRTALATNANRHGRIAGNNAVSGNKLKYPGTIATSIIKICDIAAARTGLTEAECEKADIAHFSVLVPSTSSASYYPEPGWLILKITAEAGTGRILGAQCIGDKGVDKRIDVIATAIYANLTVFDLENLDLAYAPPFSSAKGPEIMGGMIASNELRGDVKSVMPPEIASYLEATGAELIDVRTQEEWDGEGFIEGARLVPLDELRNDLSLLDRCKKYLLYCGVGKRAYNACRFLAQNGFDVCNVSGGYYGYTMDV